MTVVLICYFEHIFTISIIFNFSKNLHAYIHLFQYLHGFCWWPRYKIARGCGCVPPPTVCLRQRWVFSSVYSQSNTHTVPLLLSVVLLLWYKRSLTTTWTAAQVSSCNLEEQNSSQHNRLMMCFCFERYVIQYFEATWRSFFIPFKV